MYGETQSTNLKINFDSDVLNNYKIRYLNKSQNRFHLLNFYLKKNIKNLAPKKFIRCINNTPSMIKKKEKNLI